MINGILGKKLGMTRVFEENGAVTAVTVIEAGPCTITQIKTRVIDGYDKVQLGFSETKRLNSPQRGHLRRSGGMFRELREIPVSDLEDLEVGQRVTADMFAPGEIIKVTGISKGRGFAGSVKRHGFHGGPKTHGQSDRHRAPGSIGAGTYPGKVFKGQKMAGHMGQEQVTVKGLQVVQVDEAKNLLLVKGAVPGPPGGLVVVCKS
jgi:large subunit ribosomal protein L3